MSTSTTESEYIVLGRAGEQIRWMYAAMREIGMEVPNLALLMGDNTGLIAIAENKRNHNRVKHIDVRHHFIRSEVEEGRIKINYVASNDNLADLFTKSLPQAQHYKLCAKL